LLNGTGQVEVGNASVGVPLIAARASERADIQFNLNQGSDPNPRIVIRQATTPILDEVGAPEYVTLYSRTLGNSNSTGDQAMIRLFGRASSGDMTLDSGALLHARTGDFLSSTPANPTGSALIGFNNSIALSPGTININGNLLGEATGSSFGAATVFLWGGAVNAPGAITANGRLEVKVTSGNLVLGGKSVERYDLFNSGSGSIDLSVTGDATVVQAVADSGDVSLSASGALSFGNVTAGSTGTVSLDSGPGINHMFSTVTGALLDLTTVGGGLVNTSVSQLSASNTGGGTIDITNASALDIAGITAGSADINITTLAGDLTYSGGIDATGQIVTLTPAGGIFHSGTATIRAFMLDATATGGIDMLTELIRLDATNSGAGGIFIENTGDIDILGLVDSGTGDITVQNSRTLSNTGPISAAGGDVTLRSLTGNLNAFANVTAAGDVIFEALDTEGTISIDPVLVSGTNVFMTGYWVRVDGGNITTTADMGLVAANNVSLFSGSINAGGLALLEAGNTVAANSSPFSIEADALAVFALSGVNLSAATLMTYNGSVPTLQDGVTPAGDSTMLADFEETFGGNVPGSTLANAVFEAPSVTLGTYDFYGDYLYLKADTLTLNQAVGTWLPGTEPSPGTVNPNVIVQMTPYTAGQQVVVEDIQQAFQPGVTRYSNNNHFQQFPGTSLFVGISWWHRPAPSAASATSSARASSASSGHHRLRLRHRQRPRPRPRHRLSRSTRA